MFGVGLRHPLLTYRTNENVALNRIFPLQCNRVSLSLIFIFVVSILLPDFDSEHSVVEAKEEKESDAVGTVDPDRRANKRARMKKELDGLIEDNAGKSERDRMEIWRKIQKYLARNDDIANE